MLKINCNFINRIKLDKLKLTNLENLSGTQTLEAIM